MPPGEREKKARGKLMSSDLEIDDASAHFRMFWSTSRFHSALCSEE